MKALNVSPHPFTIASIELQGVDKRSNGWTFYRCGCQHLEWLAVAFCQYHEGYDDGVEAALRGDS